MHRCILRLDGHTRLEVFTLVMYGYLGIQHIWASRSQAQTCMLFRIAVYASVWHSSLLFILFLQKKITWMQTFPKSMPNLSCLWKTCVFKDVNDNLKQPKPAGAATRASNSSRLRQHQDLVQSPAPSPRLAPLNLARILGTYCTISPNALKWASLVHFPQGLQ